MATQFSILAWRIPWTEEPGELYSPRGPKEPDTTERLISKKQMQLQQYFIEQITHLFSQWRIDQDCSFCCGIK